MASSLKVRIVTPRKVAFEGVAVSVQAPGELGEFGVLPGHIALVSALKVGNVVVSGQPSRRFRVGVGFAEVGPDRVTLMVETCEELTEK
jgi:F-type H+-transporting ATPase subunit epsilon